MRGGLTYYVSLTLAEQWGLAEGGTETGHSDLALPHVQMPGAASGTSNLEGRNRFCLTIHCPLAMLMN